MILGLVILDYNGSFMPFGNLDYSGYVFTKDYVCLMGVLECVFKGPGKNVQILPFQLIWLSYPGPDRNSMHIPVLYSLRSFS